MVKKIGDIPWESDFKNFDKNRNCVGSTNICGRFLILNCPVIFG